MSDTVVLDGELSLTNQLDGEAGTIIKVAEYEHPVYDGPTTVTPTQQTQTLNTQQKIVLTDIIINPIPSNYGLITWDGSTLTVS